MKDIKKVGDNACAMLARVSNSVQYFPLVSVQYFPLFPLFENDFYDA
jgi:hypothetical protein